MAAATSQFVTPDMKYAGYDASFVLRNSLFAITVVAEAANRTRPLLFA
jgi:hypothetical protein